ncbi:sensor histidine kinase [Butyrivibrio sp. YAB3001]|uniref:sensor histidine kinase n=1 Tax=Butyrivibrio sp. YAB3001 TaxID=1520812 RepID=UPI0008F630AE|nr:sensor histidine kinase [Butyrivibrio sp. YAB3001]SFB81892.1 HAMP domain-containing protein [Butyrivibrio sp. YAB3001]
MKKMRHIWENLTIKNKIRLFSSSVFVALSVALLLDVWIVKLFMVDFNDVMEANSKCGEIVTTLGREIDLFDGLIRGTKEVDQKTWEESVSATKKAIYAMPLNYEKLGDDRYAQLQALRSAYEVYCSYRNQVITDHLSENMYIEKMYDVYSMQQYLAGYAQKFVESNMQEGNQSYRALRPIAIRAPFIAAILSVCLFFFILQISRILNGSVTVPVIKLANASRKIAANDFFIDDVKVDNKDELGDMVAAFNKMKFATGEYIKAMEEKREALDKLHLQEMENLEIEKQLEAMNLELLKSQINPHFLFNTLNVIAGNANLEGAETTEQMIEALSSIFRYNLKNHSKEALLYQELKISKDYMYLQQMRFGDRLKFSIDCMVDENKIIVPTFTFQPLLENAIIHGISPKVEGGSIKVAIREDGGKLVIDVSDTGVGMDDELLSDIRENLQDLKETIDGNEAVGIGLGNINRRIRTMYDEGSLDIVSKKNEGTVVTICIPLHGVDD